MKFGNAGGEPLHLEGGELFSFLGLVEKKVGSSLGEFDCFLYDFIRCEWGFVFFVHSGVACVPQGVHESCMHHSEWLIERLGWEFEICLSVSEEDGCLVGGVELLARGVFPPL